MSQVSPEHAFVRAALAAGHSRARIQAELEAAGWPAPMITAALSQYADTAFEIPVPAPRRYLSLPEIFSYVLLFIALAVLAVHTVAFLHTVVDLLTQSDLEDGPWRWSAANWSVAMLAVFGPIYVRLHLLDRRKIQSDPHLRLSLVRRWMVLVALLAASLTLLGDLAWVIYRFLEGGLNLRFLAKSAVVALVAGVIFALYRRDLGER